MFKRVVGSGLAAGALLGAGQAFGAGFALIEQSASGMGAAFAGAGAVAEDASTIFFNPAGMSFLDGRQAVLAVHWIAPKASFSNGDSRAANGAPLTGPDATSDVGAAVPNLYAMTPIDEKWTVGVGINAPFGLETDYPEDWIGRYHAVNSDVRTINLNPSASYRVNDRLALGFGINAQYIDVNLSSAVDFGSVIGLAPQNLDGLARIEGDNWAWGWNAGLMYAMSPQTRVGLAYRSTVTQDVSGDAEFDFPNDLVGTLVTSMGMFTPTGAGAEVTLPATASANIYHEVTPRLALMADATWTGWGVFDELRIEYENPNQPDSVTTENWDNNWRFGVGARYQLNDKVALRAGVALDQTPIPDAEHRTPRIPGNDRTWAAFGFSYDVTPNVTVDAGYAHLFVSSTDIHNTFESSVSSINHTLDGEYESDVDIFSAQLAWKF